MRSLCSPTDAVLRVESPSRLRRASAAAGEWVVAILAVVVGLVLLVPAAVLFVMACARMGRTDPAELHAVSAEPRTTPAEGGFTGPTPHTLSRGGRQGTRVQDSLAAPHAAIWN